MEQSPSESNTHTSTPQTPPPPPFMETECSLPCSQEPVTGPYPESNDSSAHIPNLYPQDPF